MMFSFEWVEKRNNDWIVATVKDVLGVTTTDVSINRNDKNTGAVAFPSFDTFAPGATVEANLWTSPAGKHYLFAPKPSTGAPSASGKGFGGAGVKAAQERKAEGIEKAQERRETGVKVAAAMRDSTLIALEMHRVSGGMEDFKSTFATVKEWYMKEWDKTEEGLDLPF